MTTGTGVAEFSRRRSLLMVCLCEGDGTAVHNRNVIAIEPDKRKAFEICYRENGQEGHHYCAHLNHLPNLI